MTRSMANFEEIEEARKLLGLGEAATLNEIKSVYKSMAQRHHPDKHGGASTAENEIMKRLNRAYKLLMDYCADYKYSFRQEDVARVYPEEEDYKRWHEKWPF
jgi:DnaJ-class molecular chaperone